MRLFKLSIVIIVLLILSFGCSKGSSNPVTGDILPGKQPNSSIDALPIVAFDGLSAVGLLGAFNLDFSDDYSSAELTPMRTSAIGESFIVSGESYFVTRPCVNCLRISYIGLTSNGDIALGFWLRHPFPKGDPGQPPSGKNRLDLDLFDVALSAIPLNSTPVNYAKLQVSAYTGYILNANGYTDDLSGVTEQDAILPYKICYEKRTNNRFEMGTPDHYFYLVFAKGAAKQFNLYLTMGYGASATLPDRLVPTYYIPEFNRKSAWKVEVEDQTWYGSDPSTVTIDIYDWNHGATVATTFPDPAHPNYIKSSSNISAVTVEVPGMTTNLIQAETSDTSTNGWDNPITYTATFTNQNSIPQGDYTGLVKVLDSRAPGSGLSGDSLIHVPDGVTLQSFDLDEFATYQIFKATIAPPCGPITGQIISPTCPISGVKDDDTIDFVVTASSANNGNPIVLYEADWDYDGVTFNVDASNTTGVFDGGGPFINPNCPELIPVTYTVAFRAKDSCFHPNITVFATCDVTVDLCCGPITGQIDSPSCPVSGVANHQTIDFVVSASSANDGNPIVLYEADWDYDGTTFDVDASNSTGIFNDGGPFNNPNCPGSGDPAMLLVAFRATDSCDPPNTTLFATCEVNVDICAGWALTWGGTSADESRVVAKDSTGNIYVAGYFSDTVDLDPSSGEDEHTSNGLSDIFLSKFSDLGVFLWAISWGGEGSDVPRDIYIDGSNNLFITGFFSGTADFDPGSGTDSHSSVDDTPDIFLSKFDSNGNFLWAKTWGGNSDDSGNAVCINNAQNIFVTGFFDSTVDFDPGGGTFNLTSAGLADIFISKLDSSGNFIHAFKMGSWGYDEGEELVADSSGNIIIAGQFFARFDFDPGSGVDEHQAMGEYDCFLAKYDSSLNYIYALTWGGFGTDKALGLALGPSENLYVAGFFQDTVDFNPDPALIHEVSSAGNSDAYVSIFNNTGVFTTVIKWGGTNVEEAHDIITKSDYFAVAGCFAGTNVDFDPGTNTVNRSSNGFLDAYASKFDITNNEFVDVNTWGGTQSDEAQGIAFDKNGYVLCVGKYSGTVDFDPGPWTDNHTSNGDIDAYLNDLVL